MELSCEFISGSANTLPSCAFWKAIGGGSGAPSNGSIVVYGVSNLVAVVDESNHKIACTLKSHTGRVTSVFGLSGSNGSFYIFSGSEDKTIKVWRNSIDSSANASASSGAYERNLTEWTLMSDINLSMKNPIVNIHAVSVKSPIGEEVMILSSVDAGGGVTCWALNASSSTESKCQEIIINNHAPAQMPRCVTSVCRESDFFVFVGSVDSKIYIYLMDLEEHFSNSSNSSSISNGRQFKLVGVLSGHEEWITSIAVSDFANSLNSFLVATSSQDNKIRLWKFKSVNNDVTSSEVAVKVQDIQLDDDDDFEANIDAEETDVQLDREEIANEARLQFESRKGKTSYLVFLDALLIGHEDWVTSVSFFPKSQLDSEKIRLFSTSMDRNFIIWEPDKYSGVWAPSTRMGDIGGTLGGSVGGNLLGFVNGCIAPDGSSILGVGFGGSFHLWNCDNESSRWHPKSFISGHFGPVSDIKWEPLQGRYVMSVSSDQTCRLFSPVLPHLNRANAENSWKEISRPLIHGYDLSSICLSNPPSFQIFCGGDEKVIRVYDAPTVVLEGLRNLCGLDIDLDNENKRISKAYIPELGLSNKAAQLMSNEEKKELEIRGVNGVDWTYAPLEGQLADHTIWPEVKKLFSHNNDVTCIDTSADGILIASASKARDAKSASIIIWSAVGMIPLEDLPGHESTVVRVKFSPDSKFLASGGKDRSLCVYRRGDDNKFISCKCIKEAHKRIIWDCCWSPDSRFLVSASRDGSCRIWSLVAHESDLNHVDLVLVHSFSPFSGESVTSVDMTSIDGQFVLACGSEHGNLSLWSIDQAGSSTACIHVVSDKFSHGSTISRIQWKQSSSGHQLATCGEDHTVRIFTLRVGHI